ncbi:MAG: glycine cleavage system aminomethyltransferase GcvT [Planctomycetota bacterium]
MADSLKTPLHAWHASHGGRMVDFAGWSMPVQFTSIMQEHVATRRSVGVFDISHMGRLEFRGPEPLKLLDRLVTRRVARLKPGGIRYALVTNERGGILDDVLVYHLRQPNGDPRVLMVVNASNREKIIQWIAARRGEGDAELVDLTRETAMIAVQGPAAIALVAPLLNVNLAEMKYYTGTMAQLDGHEVVVSRTGYTGEDGCELWVAADAATTIWEKLFARGGEVEAVPVGLGARDSLRLEAAMPLYGHELSEQVHPFQAGLSFAVQLKDHEFVGRQALAAAKADTTYPVRIGLSLEGRRVPREHYPLLSDGAEIGEVTSGTFSPTLRHPIAMGYVPREKSATGTVLEVGLRGRRLPATVVDLPFYSRD